MVNPVSFGALLRQCRRARDLTQEELARQAACAISTIKKIEADERRPSRDLAERFAHILAVPSTDQTAFLRIARGISPGAMPRPLPLMAWTAEEIGTEDFQGREVRGYAIRERIGVGAFGVVYRAIQPAIQREVAIKILLPKLADHPDFIRRFEAEARIVASLEHPHIVPLYDYWREPNSAYLIMRYMRGGSLATALKDGPLAPSDVLVILEQVGSALMATHEDGIVHRDLKPANILRDAAGHAYLADFGIASVLGSHGSRLERQSGVIVGSLNYLAPEQITGDRVVPATDIYSLGLTLYELLTGQHPFRATTPEDLVPLILSTPVPPLRDCCPGVPPALNDVIQRATAKNPADRYTTVHELVGAVRAALKGSGSGLVKEHVSTDIDTRQRPAQEPVHSDNPYKGLRAFSEADTSDFFGRNTLVVRLLERLAEPGPRARFLAVVGPSGSGKSSVVRAGLIPALRQGGVPGSDHWFITEIIPGSRPLEELELALLRVGVRQPANLDEYLRRDERGLLRAARLMLPDDDSELVVVIDQFEELFTLVADGSVRTHVLDSIVAAITDPHSRVRVVITLRADFYDRPLHHPALGELLRSRTEVVLPLTLDEVEQAIVGPAKRAGLRVEPELVTDIVRDVSNQPGMLPLLQYALTELFELRDDCTLTRAAYRASGGVRGALARRAEAIYTDLDPNGRAAARQLFLRLITLGEGVEDTRRRVVRSELVRDREVGEWAQQDTTDSATATLKALLLGPASTMEEILQRYGRARLLTFDRDPLTHEPTVEVAHEALIRAWNRLREWLDGSRADMRTHRVLSAVADDWSHHDRDPGFLATGSRLAQFVALAEGGDLALNTVEHAFLAASMAERDRVAHVEHERQERELAQARVLMQAQHHAARRLRVLVAGLLVFLVGASGLAAFAFTQRSRAATSLRQSEAQRLAAQAQALYQANGSAEVIALLAIRSLGMEYTPEGDAALAAAASLEYPRYTLSGHTNWVQAVAFSPDSHYVLTGSSDATVKLWDARTGQVVHTFEGHGGPINAVAFSPNGKIVATASDDKTARIWDIETQRQVGILDGFGNAVWGLAFSPNGQLIATASLDETARIWDVQTGEQIQIFNDHHDQVYGVAFSPDGTMVASSGNDWVIRLWDVQTGTAIRKFEGHTEQVRSVAFSPDGKYLLSGSHDKTARLWDVQTGTQRHDFVGHREFIWQVTFSSDGKYALTASQDKIARLWDVASGVEVHRYTGHTNYVVAIAISPDGSTIATGGRDQQVHLWNVQGNTILPTFRGHTKDIHWAVFSPNGRYIFTGSLDGTGRLWNARSGKLVHVLKGHKSTIHTVAFAPDGRSVFTCSFDKTARMWDVQTGLEIHQFTDHTGAVYGIAVSSDGQYLATSGDTADPTVRLWNARTGEALLILPGHRATVHSLTFSPDNKYILSGSYDQTARLWDVQTGALVRTLNMPDSAVSVAFSPDGRFILTGGNDKMARLWDVQTGQEVRQFVGHTDIVKAAVFSADGVYVLTGSADNTVRLWNAQTGQEIRRISGHTGIVNTVAFSADGRYILSGSGDSTARLWHREYQETIRALCGRLLRDLTPEERAQHHISDNSPICQP